MTSVDTTVEGVVRAEVAEAMVRDMCAAVDEHDFERFGGYFAEAAAYRFGNAPEIAGREAIVAATAGAVSSIPPVHHRVDQVAVVGRQLFCRFTIGVDAPEGALAMPCVTVIELEPASGGEQPQVVDYRVHMDICPAVRSTP